MNYANVLDYENIIEHVCIETAKLNKKRCSKCTQIKSIKEFYKNKSKPGGYGNQCKDCCKEKSIKQIQMSSDYRKKYYEKHKEELKGRQRAYYQENRDSYLMLNKSYRAKDKERMRKSVECLEDNYIKSLLINGSSLEFSDIPPELIEFKREHLRIKRELKNHK